MQIHILIDLRGGVHLPLSTPPAYGQWVYLATRARDELIYLPYHSGLSDALREGRIYEYKEDALVLLYGQHYATV